MQLLRLAQASFNLVYEHLRLLVGLLLLLTLDVDLVEDVLVKGHPDGLLKVGGEQASEVVVFIGVLWNVLSFGDAESLYLLAKLVAFDLSAIGAPHGYLRSHPESSLGSGVQSPRTLLRLDMRLLKIGSCWVSKRDHLALRSLNNLHELCLLFLWYSILSHLTHHVIIVRYHQLLLATLLDH